MRIRDLFIKNRKFDKKINGIFRDFKQAKEINANDFDNRVDEVADELYKKYSKQFSKSEANNTKIAFVASEIYEIGGHTKCLINFIKSFYQDYSMILFLTKLKNTVETTYKANIPQLKELLNIDGIDVELKNKNCEELVINLYNKIVSQCSGIIFSYIHPDDIVASIVFSILKKHSKVKIIFFNHVDHLPVVGIKFCDLIIDARPSGQDVNIKIRNYKNSHIIPLQSKKQEETMYYSEVEIHNCRKNLGINDGDFFTLTGCANYKIFDQNGSSYLKMIKKLLIEESKLKHIIMTKLSPDQQDIFDQEFLDREDLLERVKVIDMVSDFDIFFQSCDLFIDSFPQGSALTHIDMMRNKKPTVIKIDRQDPFKSFEFYLPKNYEYAYEDIEDMKEGILKLLYSDDLRKKVSKELYEHYLQNYEFEIVKQQYLKLIENINKLEVYYDA